MRDDFVRDRLPPADRQPEFLFDRPELHYPGRLNAAGALIRGDPDRLAIVNAAGSWSYGKLDDLSDRIARLLVEEEGLVAGNRVLLRGPNGTMLFAAWLGVLKAGGILVTTMPILRPGEIATILERAQVHHAIVDSRSVDDFHKAADATGMIRSLLLYDGDAGGGPLEQRLERIAPGFAPADTGRDDVAMILHIGHHRQAQGLRPISSRRPRLRRRLRRQSARSPSGRPLGLLGADRLHLWAWPVADLPVALRRHGGNDRGAEPRGPARRGRDASGERPRHRADRLQGDDRPVRGPRHFFADNLRLGR
jgi:hypothetical protein